MITRAENDRLTRVTGDVSLGNMLRENYWIPVARSPGIAAGGAPERLRILGRDLVIFRAENGQIGLLDERCPHRRASLALARVEGCSLRCLYHGWRMDGSGRVVEVPSEGARSEQFAARVQVQRYRVAEAGGLIWAFFGQKDPPDLPPLPFLKVPEEGRWFCRMKVNCNWLQGFEGALDSVHLNWLHQGWAGDDRQQPFRPSPVYEIERTAYGLRTAAIREGGAEVHFRVAEFVAPFFALSASRQPSIPSDFSVFISVPVDDETHLLFFGFWDANGRLHDISKHFSPELDPNDLITGEFAPENRWSQDRAAMAAGHFSGVTRSVLHEDVAVQVSMGPIVDRSLENLCGTDLAIVRMRRYLLGLLDRFESGQPVDGALDGYRTEGHLPLGCSAPIGTDWRTIGSGGPQGFSHRT